MGFDGQTEAVGVEGVLALQVGADSVDVVLGKCVHRERAASGASLPAGGAECEVAGVRLDQGKCTLTPVSAFWFKTAKLAERPNPA